MINVCLQAVISCGVLALRWDVMVYIYERWLNILALQILHSHVSWHLYHHHINQYTFERNCQRNYDAAPLYSSRVCIPKWRRRPCELRNQELSASNIIIYYKLNIIQWGN